MTEELKAYIERLIQEEVRPTLAEQAAALMRETQANGDFLREQWKHYPTREERLADEERRAWDGYFRTAAHIASADMHAASPGERMRDHYAIAAEHADCMLAERRKRFGSAKEAEPRPGKVAVSRELLLKCLSGLRGDVPEHARHLFADDLRALVSE